MDETRKRKVECTKEEEEAKREEKRRLDREKKRERRLECPALPSCAMCGAVGVDLHRLSSFPPNLVSQLAAASGCILPPSGHVCGAHFTSSLPQSVRTEGERDVASKPSLPLPFGPVLLQESHQLSEYLLLPLNQSCIHQNHLCSLPLNFWT
jgi:hypothetical protein